MSNKKAIIIGISVLALAACVVLLCVLAPMLGARKELKKAVSALCNEEAQYLLVGDPLYKTDDYLGNNGKEVLLDDTQAGAVRAHISAFFENCSYKEQQKLSLGAWDLYVLAKNADGTVTRVYFTDGQFYCTKGDAAMVFTPDNAEAYAAFYATLKAMLQ